MALPAQAARRPCTLHLRITFTENIILNDTYTCPPPFAGGEKILDVFELKLKEAINKLPFQKILTLKNVQVRSVHSRGCQRRGWAGVG